MFLSKKRLARTLSLTSVNFNKPWWYLIIEQKLLVLLIFAVVMSVYTFWTLSPFLILKAFESGSFFWCLALFIVWICVDTTNAWMGQFNMQFQLRIIHSIHKSAHLQLLQVDPHYHVHRSSGAILGKIDRAARGYEDLLDQITFEFVPLFVRIITMMFVLSRFSWQLALGVLIVFICMIIGGYYFARYLCQPWEQGFIATDDNFRSTAVENLAQIQLIRSCFASDFMSKKLVQKIETNMKAEGSLWMIYRTASFTLNMIYLCAIFSLISVLFWQIQQGITDVTYAVALVVAFVQSTKDIVSIAKPFRRYMRGWAAVKDLFDFMRTFGKQNFPVLGVAEELHKSQQLLAVRAQEISFDYETARLFNHHTFAISVSRSQENKLYGIIGPSGSGKTTLLSILGGQLKPISGNVIINGTDIYKINDPTRRELIALQGQTATSVRGTVKYNMLFGLPESHQYTDEYLMQVLERVGLTQVLAVHKGLHTMLGEGGLSISGGQRQRLNFASLYLRAHFYKPVLILIDEPTSSLDEISEAAITAMIEELSLASITLVIAHRLKTLDQAKGLIDLSLLDEEKDIAIYSPDQLMEKSEYYRQLVQGHVPFDA